jgi:hypothetical protein
MLTYSFVGSAATVRAGLADFCSNTCVDEVFAVTAMYDHPARLQSYEVLASIAKDFPQLEKADAC